jgi:hypothetical protein
MNFHRSALDVKTVHQGLPITMKVQSRRPNGDYSEEIIRPTYPDYNTLDFEELYQAIVEGSPVKTTPADGESGAVQLSMRVQRCFRGSQGGLGVPAASHCDCSRIGGA